MLKFLKSFIRINLLSVMWEKNEEIHCSFTIVVQAAEVMATVNPK